MGDSETQTPNVLAMGWWCMYEGMWCGSDPEDKDFDTRGHYGSACGEEEMNSFVKGIHVRAAVVRLPT